MINVGAPWICLPCKRFDKTVSSLRRRLSRALSTMTRYLYPDEQQRTRLAPVMFEALVRYDCLLGQVGRLPGFTAVATWMRPGETVETLERLAAAGFDDLPAEVPLARPDAFFSTIGPAHQRAAPEPHWYLGLLGVDPAHHGQGLGSTLLEHGLRRADETSQPCYLETFAERNVPFYLRHGFELVLDETEPSSGIRTWGFHRARAHQVAPTPAHPIAFARERFTVRERAGM